ncbi:threonine/serine ThrE exporter family protein [Propionibacteriaceae bacterium Y1923]|uniref:threonine/serine ThrE exporter family protein n=1 Tax=Aestuariimicrobium sp. Y1814 TaxID=3418742 RepID=UPI003C22C9F9
MADVDDNTRDHALEQTLPDLGQDDSGHESATPAPVVSYGPLPTHIFRTPASPGSASSATSPGDAPPAAPASQATPNDPVAPHELPLPTREDISAHRRSHRQRTGARERSGLRRLRAQARRIWSETAENTAGTSMLSTTEVDLRHSRAVVDLAGRVAAAALGAGATAADSTALLLRVTQHYKLSVHADVTMSSVNITHFRSLEGDPITILRTVQTKTTDYRKLAAVEHLVDNITADELTLTEARGRIAQIVRMPKTYRRWVQTLAKGFLGFWVAALFGGNIWDMLIAGVTTAVVDLAIRGIAVIKAPSFFGQAAGAAVCGAAALGVMAARAHPGWNVDVSPSLVVAAGMISMLAGLSLTTAIRDAIDGYYLTAAARLVQVATLTGGIVLGLTVTLWVGLELGIPAYLSPTTGVRPVWWMQVIASSLIAVAFAVNNHLPPKAWVVSAGFGLLAWLVSSGAGTRVSADAATAGAAAFVVGIAAQALTRAVKVPSIALVTAGVVSLVPGMALYRGLLGLVNISQGITVTQDSNLVLFQALMVAVMLAAGASLGTVAGRPLSMPADWPTRLALGKAWRRGHDDAQNV